MIPVSFFLAAAVEVVTLFTTWVALAGEDNADPDMRRDALKVFCIGTTIAAAVASFHFI